MASAKELMRLSGTAKSLVTNHLTESLSGAATIRAFDGEDRFFAKCLELIDNNASPYFHNIAADEWLIQRIEAMSAVVTSTSALAMSVFLRGSITSGELVLGLKLTSPVYMPINSQLFVLIVCA